MDYDEKNSLRSFVLLGPWAVQGWVCALSVYVLPVWGPWRGDALKPRLGQPLLPQRLQLICQGSTNRWGEGVFPVASSALCL